MAKIAIFVCGSKAAVSMEFAGGAIKHLIVNWKTFEARVSSFPLLSMDRE